MALVLRRVNGFRKGGSWSKLDFAVLDGDHEVGCIYRVDDQPELWFWNVSVNPTKHKLYGHAPTLDEAKAAFRSAYVAPPRLR
jgi:hypothetical protein